MCDRIAGSPSVVIQTNLSFPILSWSVKLVFSLKTSIVTINGSGIVDSELSGFNSTPIYCFYSMNSISKGNNINFRRILVRRTILNCRITPESTIL